MNLKQICLLTHARFIVNCDSHFKMQVVWVFFERGNREVVKPYTH